MLEVLEDRLTPATTSLVTPVIVASPAATAESQAVNVQAATTLANGAPGVLNTSLAVSSAQTAATPTTTPSATPAAAAVANILHGQQQQVIAVQQQSYLLLTGGGGEEVDSGWGSLLHANNGYFSQIAAEQELS
jgi:hypothetical protein